MTHTPALPLYATALACTLAGTLALACAPARAQGPEALHGLINAYRAAPADCNGRRPAPAPPLARHRALSNVRVARGVFLDQLLEKNGFPVAKADAIHVSGPKDASEVMAAIATPYCKTLLSTQFSFMGAGRSGDTWLILLAEPEPPPAASLLPDSPAAGKQILQAVNTARAVPRSCGEQHFPPAPSLVWNGTLGDAALVHSRDMAAQRYFSHKARDGSEAGVRALAAGYRWRRIGENIAAGQSSPDEVVAGWLSSPGHCANIMNGGFTEMGAAYAINRSRPGPRVYWTQVFGAPR